MSHAAVHLHTTPGRAVEGREDAVVDGPAPPADRPVEPDLPERGGPVEGHMEPASGAELAVDRLHELLTEEIVAAAALVEKGRMVEEWLDQEEVLAEEPAEALHRVQHPAEEPQPRSHLTGRQSRRHCAPLLGEIAGHRAEEGVQAVLVPVDPEALRSRIRDLDEAELGNPEWTDLDVDQHQRIAVVARCAEL